MEEKSGLDAPLPRNKGLAFSLPVVRLQAGFASGNNQLPSYRKASSPY